jgi:hypothetical protein
MSYELIRQAIINKQQVIADYHGYTREMCPHVLGTKNGRAQGLFYQFGGGSRGGLGLPGSADNWRCIIISDLRNVAVRDGEWHTGQRHSQRQTCVDRVDVEVEF